MNADRAPQLKAIVSLRLAMDKDELAKLVDAWITDVLFGRTEPGHPTPAHKESWGVLEQVMNWKYDNRPELLWRFILSVHERDNSEEVARHLSAGPVEDLMSQFGEAYIDRIEELAQKDARFKRMLGGTWQDAMSDGLWSRFQKARSE